MRGFEHLSRIQRMKIREIILQPLGYLEKNAFNSRCIGFKSGEVKTRPKALKRFSQRFQIILCENPWQGTLHEIQRTLVISPLCERSNPASYSLSASGPHYSCSLKAQSDNR